MMPSRKDRVTDSQRKRIVEIHEMDPKLSQKAIGRRVGVSQFTVGQALRAAKVARRSRRA